MGRARSLWIDWALAAAVLAALSPWPSAANAEVAEHAGASTDQRTNAPPAELYRTPGPRPPDPRYGSATPAPLPTMSAQALADALADTYFKLERGKPRMRLFKWTAPPNVVLDPALATHFGAFLDAFLTDAGRRAERPIARPATHAVSGEPAIHVRVAPTYGMMRRLGGALCIAVPDDVTWESYLARLARREAGARNLPEWATLTTLSQATVFVPDRALPHQVRACLMEEILQALGPAGDFFDLPHSIFNDDGAHLRPTAFDHLAVAALYAAPLKPGAAEADVRKAMLAAVLATGPRPAADAATSARSKDAVYAPWVKKLRSARAQRHPKFGLDEYDAALALTQGRGGGAKSLTLFTGLERARLWARVSPQRALAEFRALRAAHVAHYGPHDVRIGLIDLDAAETTLGEGDGAAAAGLARAALPLVLAHARDDQIARAYLILEAAAAGVRRIHTGRPANGVTAEAWRLYAFGAPTRAPSAIGDASQATPDIAKTAPPSGAGGEARAAATLIALLSLVGVGAMTRTVLRA